jgi:hypothetical protein
MRAIACRCGAAAMVISGLLSGCSLFAGPTHNARRPDIHKIEQKAGADWTDFKSVEEAQKRLRGVARYFRDRASNVSKSSEAGSDLSVSSLIAGSIAGATGSEQGALIGGGLASLIGIGFDRYKLTTQRDNMVKAAIAYTCVAESVHGITTAMLSNPIAPDSRVPNADELDPRRVTLVSDLGSTARQIQDGFETAQRNVVFVQPNLSGLESAIKGEQEQNKKLPPEAQRRLASMGAGLSGKTLSGKRVFDKDSEPEIIRKDMRTLEAAREVAAAELKKEEQKTQKSAAVITAFKGTVATLDMQIESKRRDLGEALANAWLDSGSADQQLLLITTLTTIAEKLKGCKAQVGV